MDLYFIVFIIAILSYSYLFNEINKNNYFIILIYFMFLIIGYNIVGMKMYLYNFIIIIYDLFKQNIFTKKILEGSQSLEKTIVKVAEANGEIMAGEISDSDTKVCHLSPMCKNADDPRKCNEDILERCTGTGTTRKS